MKLCKEVSTLKAYEDTYRLSSFNNLLHIFIDVSTRRYILIRRYQSYAALFIFEIYI